MVPESTPVTELRLHVTQPSGFANRRQFFALTAKIMRQVLIDHARRLQRHKRGAGAALVPLSEAVPAPRRS